MYLFKASLLLIDFKSEYFWSAVLVNLPCCWGWGALLQCRQWPCLHSCTQTEFLFFFLVLPLALCHKMINFFLASPSVPLAFTLQAPWWLSFGTCSYRIKQQLVKADIIFVSKQIEDGASVVKKACPSLLTSVHKSPPDLSVTLPW